jgi:hypothetical protein
MHFMKIQFFDDPSEMHKDPEDVRIKDVNTQLYPDMRRVLVGFDITPFRVRPSLEVTVTNAAGRVAGALNVIETLAPQFEITMHLRDRDFEGPYELAVTAYYVKPGEERQVVDEHKTTIAQ